MIKVAADAARSIEMPRLRLDHLFGLITQADGELRDALFAEALVTAKENGNRPRWLVDWPCSRLLHPKRSVGI